MKKDTEMIIVKKTRDSNIELLRIVAMMMIIMHHLVYHTGVYKIIGEKHFIISIMLSGGKIAVVVYILIMGYYSKKSRFNIVRPINIIIKVIIYSIIFMCIFNFENIKNFSLKEFMQYWFINVWLLLFMIEPIIKICENKLPKTIKRIIFVWMTILFILPNVHLNDIQSFIYFYLCGRHFLHKIVEEFDNQKLNILILIILYVFIVAKRMELAQNSITTGVTAITLFTIFANIKIKSKIINNVAKHTLGVYLIHDNKYVEDNIIVNGLNIQKMYYTNYFYIYTLGIGVAIFVVCSIIDFIISKIIAKIILENRYVRESFEEINKFVNKFLLKSATKNNYI